MSYFGGRFFHFFIPPSLLAMSDKIAITVIGLSEIFSKLACKKIINHDPQTIREICLQQLHRDKSQIGLCIKIHRTNYYGSAEFSLCIRHFYEIDQCFAYCCLKFAYYIKALFLTRTARLYALCNFSMSDIN